MDYVEADKKTSLIAGVILTIIVITIIGYLYMQRQAERAAQNDANTSSTTSTVTSSDIYDEEGLPLSFTESYPL